MLSKGENYTKYPWMEEPTAKQFRKGCLNQVDHNIDTNICDERFPTTVYVVRRNNNDDIKILVGCEGRGKENTLEVMGRDDYGEAIRRFQV